MRGLLRAGPLRAFAFLFLAFALLCSFLLIWANYRNGDRLVERQLSGTYIAITDEKCQRIGEAVVKEDALFEALLWNDDALELLTGRMDTYKQAERIVAWRRTVTQRTTSSSISDIEILGANGVRFYSREIVLPLQGAVGAWAPDAWPEGRATHWFGFRGNAYGDAPRYLYGGRRIVQNLDGTPMLLGHAFLFLRESLVRDIVADIAREGSVFLVDGEYRLLYASDPSFTRAPSAPGREASYEVYDSGGVKRMRIGSSPNRLGWRLIHDRPYFALMWTFRETRFLLYALASLCLATLTAFLLVLRGKIMTPLRSLQERLDRDDPRGRVPHDRGPAVDIEGLGLEVDRILRNNRAYRLRSRTDARRLRLQELRRIEAQINPHFLWKVLHSVRFLAMQTGPKEIVVVLDALFHLLKGTLRENRHRIPLREEMENLRRYIQIVDVIYEGNIAFRFDLDETLEDQLVPRFVLQPIVENAIYHGIDTTAQGGRITVRSRAEGGDVLLSVHDNGSAGRPHAAGPEPAEAAPHGIGLANVDRAIKIFHGNRYGVRVEPSESGTTVTLSMPRRREAARAARPG